jgi:phospholipase C
LILALVSCAGGGVTPEGRNLGGASLVRNAASAKIKHVIIVVQENRSFNNLFYGFPGAKTVKYGYDTSGDKIALQPIPLEVHWDAEHDSHGFFVACNGTGSIPGTDCEMNGFNGEWACKTPSCPSNPTYAYVPHSETKPLFAIAHQYVLADEMYASNFDASSFISHQYIIAGQAKSALDYPYGDWGCPGGPGDKIHLVNARRVEHGTERACWNVTTLGDELDSAGRSWAFYTNSVKNPNGIWSAYQVINHIYYGADWNQDVITPQKKFFDDVSNGKLRAVSWITPTCANSDHSGCASNTGPAWVASIVNAVGTSKYWDSTAIFIFWDDYGGWYDSEPPAYVDYDGLGIRVPLLIVSSYAKRGLVSHTHYEHGTILKFVEQTFGLPAMAQTDSRANPPDDAFDFGKPPRKFKKIPASLGIDYFVHQAADFRPPDAQ